MFDMTCKEKEMDFELKMAKTKESTKQQPTLMEIYTRLNKLELENAMLKVDKQYLQKENEQLRNDNQVLHNKLNVGSYDKTLFEGNNPDNGYDEEELANAYAMADTDKKFV